MSLSELARRAGKLTIDNSPSLLTAIGITGVVTTAYLTGKASFKAAEVIRAEQIRLDMYETSHPLETRDKVELVWKEYIPAVGSAMLTIACVVSANRVGARRTAAVVAAYSLSERAFTDYRDKVVEKLGANKETALRDELAQDQVNRKPVDDRTVIVTPGTADQLCFETYTGRYFKSDMETLKKALNDTNYRIIRDGYAALSDFYDRIGLPTTEISDDMGWNTENPFDLHFHGVLDAKGKPCIAISYHVMPIKGYSF